MRKPINLNFKVLKQKAVDFTILTEKEMFKFPVHEHYLREVQEIYLVYQYIPGAKFSKEEYIKLWLKKLKSKYKAYSVVYLGEIVDENKLN